MTVKWKELVDTDGKSAREKVKGGSTTPSTPTLATNSFN